MTPQNSSHQKDDMKKNPFGGPKYIRPHGTKFRRPGDLAHGIYGSLSKKKFFSEIHRFKEKRGGLQCPSYLLHRTFQRMKYEGNQSSIRVSRFDLTTVDLLSTCQSHVGHYRKCPSLLQQISCY